LTVRALAARLAAPPRPSHPAPRFVTTAKRLFGERGMASLNHNFFLSERQIFWRRGLDIAPLFEQPRKCFARRVVGATPLRRQARTCSGSAEFLRALAAQRQHRSATRLLRCTRRESARRCVAGVTVESMQVGYGMTCMAANKVTAVHRLGRLPTQGHLESRLSRGGFFFEWRGCATRERLQMNAPYRWCQPR